jgi:hypothetical protein
VQRRHNAGHLPVALNNFLESACRERAKPPSLEQISVARRGVQVTLEHQAEPRRKQDVGVGPAKVRKVPRDFCPLTGRKGI